MFSLELPHRGDSNDYTQYTIFDIKKKKKIALNYHKTAVMRVFQATQARVRNSHGKRAISVRATEVLLYFSNTYIHTYIHTCIHKATQTDCIRACIHSQTDRQTDRQIDRQQEWKEKITIFDKI